MLLQNEKFIDLKTLSQILLIKGAKGATKWCEDHDIKIHIVGNKRVVSKFMVDIEIDKDLIKDLKSKYPNKWEELYKCYIDKDRLGYLLLIDSTPNLDFRPTNQQAIPQSSFAKSLAAS